MLPIKDLRITGVELSPEEIADIKVLLGDELFDIYEGKIKGFGLEELLQLVFTDFEPVIFVRDALFSELFKQTTRKLKAVIEYLRRKRPVDSVAVEQIFQQENGSEFRLYIAVHPDQFERLLLELDFIPRERLVPQDPKGYIFIRYDEKGFLEITDMGA